MIRQLKHTFVGLAAVFALTACANMKAEGRGVDATAINKTCPVMSDHEVDPDAKSVTVDGHKIGFCCDRCVDKFNDWTDEKKDAYVKNTVADSTER